jgi:hypothetical protein
MYGQGVGSAENVPTRETQVSESLRKLDAVIGELNAAGDHLRSRLAGVTRSDPEAAGKQISAPRAILVPLAEALDTFAERVKAENERIAATLTRLEI